MVATSRRIRRNARQLHRLAFVVFAFGLLVIPFTAPQATPAPLKILPDGELRIGVNPGLSPFAFFEDGTVIGIEVDLGRALADALGLNVVFHPTGFDGVYDVVTSGTVDIAIAQVRFNPLRTRDVLYTRAYFNAGLVLVVSPDSNITEIADIGGKALAFAFGSDADTEAQRWSRRVSEFEHQPYELPVYALDAVRLDIADAALVDAITARLYLRDHPDWSGRLVDTVTVDPFSIIVDRRNVDLWRQVDRALKTLLEDQDFYAILDRWM